MFGNYMFDAFLKLLIFGNKTKNVFLVTKMAIKDVCY